ncbi:hypothetical protein KSE_17180 [Kitasatospora setae KM-6054]|uniref:DUF2191 domain-containing protein n=1 Tax=Kitasatospora setae (strain ATCC 33774 / DSM 43861 / JCM 3304 / KCC A-0304 / NBRC 14216 / KM-6054) TaxID=452652 RepID=E4N8L1_KITSK|nr:hypothetical protein KSE_17180 [Kitasatospora setae KM-6054]
MTVTLDADLALEAMLRLGATNPQDAVELIVRDYLATDRRTEARTGGPRDADRLQAPAPPAQEG